jgi:hypothetical protein
MIKTIARAIERFFAPAFELVAEVPPHALNRIVAPF